MNIKHHYYSSQNYSLPKAIIPQHGIVSYLLYRTTQIHPLILNILLYSALY